MADSPLRTTVDAAERLREAVEAADRIVSSMTNPQSPRPEELPPFSAVDGRLWTHTRERGWVRSLPLSENAELDSVAEPPEREAYEEEASVETAALLLHPEPPGARAEARHREWVEQIFHAVDEEARQRAEDERAAQRRRDREMMQLRREYTEEWPATAASRLRLRNRIRQMLRETLQANVIRGQREGHAIQIDPVWEAAHRAVCEWDGLPSNSAMIRLGDVMTLWPDQHANSIGGRAFYTEDPIEESEQDEDEDELPPALEAHSESSSSQSEDEDAADVQVRMGRMGRARRSLVFPANHTGRMLSQQQTHIQQQLRVLQECLDAEIATAADGTAFSEGAYLSMMNAVKAIWETVNNEFVL